MWRYRFVVWLPYVDRLPYKWRLALRDWVVRGGAL